MLIQLLVGGCSNAIKNGDGTITYKLMLPRDGAFECDDAQAKQMIATGQAEALAEEPTEELEQTTEELEQTTEELEQTTEELEQTTEDLTDSSVHEDLSALSVKELKNKAVELGFEVPSKITKAELIELLEGE